MTAVLQTQSLVKAYGGLVVTDSVSIDIRPRELHAIIGPNGAGKTSLVNQLCGEAAPKSGTILFEGEDVTATKVDGRARKGLLRSYQVSSIFEEFTVLENVVLAAMGAKEHAFRFVKRLVEAQGHRATALEALKAVRLDARTDTRAADLAYGARRQLELAMALATHPKCLLLDEPMAGMSTQESSLVVSLLQELKKKYSILLIEHDMDAVFALADRISVLVYGKVIFTGSPEQVRNHEQVKAVYLG